jgi:DNA-binding GntR family transcriptional regulator
MPASPLPVALDPNVAVARAVASGDAAAAEAAMHAIVGEVRRTLAAAPEEARADRAQPAAPLDRAGQGTP